MTIAKTLIKHSILMFISEIIGAILSFILIILISRIIGQEGLGKY